MGITADITILAPFRYWLLQSLFWGWPSGQVSLRLPSAAADPQRLRPLAFLPCLMVTTPVVLVCLDLVEDPYCGPGGQCVVQGSGRQTEKWRSASSPVSIDEFAATVITTSRFPSE
jgi:hypothetical protein